MNELIKRTLSKAVLFVLALSLALTTTSCNVVDSILGNEDSDDDQTALALLLGYSVVSTAAANRAAAQVRSATSAAASAVTSQAQSGSLTLRGLPVHDRQRMLAVLHQRIAKNNFERSIRPNVMLTALITPTGSCTTTGCNATLSGTENCTPGDTNSGTMTTTNLQVTFTFSGDPMNGDLGYTGTMKGDMTMNKCSSRSPDYFNFPSMTSSVTTGDMNYDGTQTQTFANASMTATSFSADITVKETSTTKSSNLAINGGAAQVINVTQSVDLLVNSVGSNIESTMSGSTFTFKASYVDTLTGTVAVTGSVGGGNVNVSRTYNNDKFTYDVACTINFDTGAGDCTTTVK
jgi:hypothetical protein